MKDKKSETLNPIEKLKRKVSSGEINIEDLGVLNFLKNNPKFEADPRSISEMKADTQSRMENAVSKIEEIREVSQGLKQESNKPK